MLEHGERSGNFHMLAAGPRNPVGVMWIALNKKGIGIHGTTILVRLDALRATAAFASRTGTWSGLPQKSKRAITSQFSELK
jgi:hypothetical protein